MMTSMSSVDPKVEAELEKWRERLQEIDKELLDVLKGRMTFAKEIGTEKKKNDIDIKNPKQREIVRHNWLAWGSSRGLSGEEIGEIVEAVLDLSEKAQK